MESIVEERELWDKRGRGKGWNEERALVEWARLCGPTAVTTYILKYWRDEIALRDKDKMAEWQTHFAKLFSYMLRHGSPMEKLQLPTFKEALEQARNAEEALLAALNACARVTERVSEIEHPEPTSFSTWFKRIQGQRHNWENELISACLSLLNLNRSSLHMIDFFGADLANSEFMGSSLRTSTLEAANLSGARCSGVTFCRANLYGANLQGANLNGAVLREADLAEANLCDANLSGADLRGAKYTKEQLAQANTDGAIFDDEPTK